MKKIFFAGVVCAVSFGAHAQGYFGVIRALTNVGFTCAPGDSCESKGQAWKFYGGTKLSPARTIDFGVGKIDAVEVSYFRTSAATASGPTQVDDFDSFGNIVQRDTTAKVKAQVDAIVLAGVARFPIVDQLSATAKLGLAYVSTTLRSEVDGLSYNSVTQTKLRPYVGLGVEYDIPSICTIVGSFDITRVDVSDSSRYYSAQAKGNLKLLGIGAQKSF
ncbi:MAG: hypothetical protein EKK47_11305 [Burkholderiales bacterium]|nr:MAG: hypothetical protein EKK47_11305 [Burkholderiales bacterium]